MFLSAAAAAIPGNLSPSVPSLLFKAYSMKISVTLGMKSLKIEKAIGRRWGGMRGG
jgi:hypothetical protein